MPEFSLSVAGTVRLASLAGIKADLDRVLEYCDRMIERYAGAHLKTSPFDIVGFTNHIDFVEWEALSASACIAYARCFVSGVRQLLDSTLLDSAEIELRSTHEFVMNLRNKHVAHSVNSFEENSVSVHVDDTFQSSTEIVSVVPRHSRQTGLALDDPAKLKQLTTWWLAKVREEMRMETQAVLQLVRAMSLEQIRVGGELKSSSSEDRRACIAKRRTQS